MGKASSGPGPKGKIARLLEQYELDSVGEYLVDRWTAEDAGDRLSLRELAREFNIQLLEVQMVEAGLEPLEGTAQQYYESLTGDEVSSGVRTQARRSLEQADVDVDGLLDEFVSRQAIHTYLTKTRSVSQSTQDSSISSSSVQNTITRLQGRIRQVTESRLDRLKDAGAITVGEFRVLVDVQVYCQDCRSQQSLADLLENEACRCQA